MRKAAEPYGPAAYLYYFITFSQVLILRLMPEHFAVLFELILSIPFWLLIKKDFLYPTPFQHYKSCEKLMPGH
jgi:hypothetical protein